VPVSAAWFKFVSRDRKFTAAFDDVFFECGVGLSELQARQDRTWSGLRGLPARFLRRIRAVIRPNSAR